MREPSQRKTLFAIGWLGQADSEYHGCQQCLVSIAVKRYPRSFQRHLRKLPRRISLRTVSLHTPVIRTVAHGSPGLELQARQAIINAMSADKSLALYGMD